MALKDWKKIGKIFPSWEKQKIHESISIFKDKNIYEVYINYGNRSDKKIFFKTNSQALKFAKSYMRTH